MGLALAYAASGDRARADAAVASAETARASPTIIRLG